MIKILLKYLYFFAFFLYSTLLGAEPQEISQEVISCDEAVFAQDRFGQERPAIIFVPDAKGICRTHILFDPQKQSLRSPAGGPQTFSQDDYFELAAHYAPVWYQDTDDDDYDADYITNFNFDGNWIGTDNWENEPLFPLYAYIYYSVVETLTHWFIIYADFHPRDWGDICIGSSCHENDMEGVQLVIQKNGSQFGKLLLASTRAHSDLEFYPEDSGVTPVKEVGAYYDAGVGVPMDGSHPKVFVEAEGHGVYIRSSVTGSDGYSQGSFAGGDGVVYRYTGSAEIPQNGDDRDVGYALIPIEESIWPKRFENPPFAEFFDYQGYRNLQLIEQIGKAFGGDTESDNKANPPWGWSDGADQNVFRGDWALDPAWTFEAYANFSHNYSLEYLNNFYFDFSSGHLIEINDANATRYFHLTYTGPSGDNPNCEKNDHNKWCIEDDTKHWPQNFIGCFEIADDSNSDDCSYVGSHSNFLRYGWNKEDYPYQAEYIQQMNVDVMTKRRVCSDLTGEDDDGWEYFSQRGYVLSLTLSADNTFAWQDDYCERGGQHGPFRLKAFFDGSGYLDAIELRAGDHNDEGAFEIVKATVVLKEGICLDGTPDGQCSQHEPLLCEEGRLVERCTKCGDCPAGKSCDENTGSCLLKPTVGQASQR